MCTRNCTNESLEDFPDDYKFQSTIKKANLLSEMQQQEHIQITQLPEMIMENVFVW